MSYCVISFVIYMYVLLFSFYIIYNIISFNDTHFIKKNSKVTEADANWIGGRMVMLSGNSKIRGQPH